MKIYMTQRYPIRTLITGRVIYDITEPLDYDESVWVGHETYNFLNNVEHSEHLFTSGVGNKIMPWFRTMLFSTVFPVDT